MKKVDWYVGETRAGKVHGYGDCEVGTVSLCGDHSLDERDTLLSKWTSALSRQRCVGCVDRLCDPTVTITLHPAAMALVRQIYTRGLHGTSIENVVERLVLDGLRREVERGGSRT